MGADLLVVHHPLLLTPVSSVAADSPKGRTLHRLVREGCALFTAHTNADAPATGSTSPSLALGIVDPAVIAPEGDGDASPTVNKIVTFAPHEDAGRIRDAMTAAAPAGSATTTAAPSPSRGRDASVRSTGPPRRSAGSARSRSSRSPGSRRSCPGTAGTPWSPRSGPCTPTRSRRTTSSSSSRPRRATDRGHGRIGRLAEPTTLRGFAEQVRRALPEPARGPGRGRPGPARGDRRGDQRRRRLPARHRARHRRRRVRHLRPAAPPGGEFLEHGGPSLVDVAHWSAEWTWLPVVERKLLERLAERGDTVDTHVSTTCTDPWTFRL